MKRYKKEPWTDRENELLQEYFHTCSNEALFAIFPGRSYKEMSEQAAFLKRKNKPFRYLK